MLSIIKYSIVQHLFIGKKKGVLWSVFFEKLYQNYDNTFLIVKNNNNKRKRKK